jgi:hypothetical protein
MSLKFSDEVLSAMGFPRLENPQEISAEFHLVEVFGISGIEIESGSVELLDCKATNTTYRAGIGDSINAIFQNMFGDRHQYADDEELWQKEHNCAPPYFVVHLGPIAASAQVTHAAIAPDMISAYNSFRTPREALNILSERHLGIAVAGLIVGSRNLVPHSKVTHFDRLHFGVTKDGVAVKDNNLSIQGTISVLSKQSASQLKSHIDKNLKLMQEVSNDASIFFGLAFKEQHCVLRFLNFFLVLERAIKSTYTSIDTAQKCKDEYGKDCTERKYLRNMFKCCSVEVWNCYSLPDFELFGRFKKIRDAIAHGERSDVEQDEVLAIELFTARFLKHF